MLCQPGHRDPKQVIASAARARPLCELPFHQSMNQPIRMASLLATPAVGFEQPFEMLEACHERVNRMLALLVRLREYLPGHGTDDNARQAARDVMRYFDLAAPHHHQDEELSLIHISEPTRRTPISY